MKNKINFLKALSDETRISIVECLKDGEQCACNIVPYTKKSQPNVSLHLKKLESLGILESRKVGTNIYYKIKDKRALKILDLLN